MQLSIGVNRIKTRRVCWSHCCKLCASSTTTHIPSDASSIHDASEPSQDACYRNKHLLVGWRGFKRPRFEALKKQMTHRFRIKYVCTPGYHVPFEQWQWHSEKSNHLTIEAWPYRRECRGHNPAKKNLLEQVCLALLARFALVHS